MGRDNGPIAFLSAYHPMRLDRWPLETKTKTMMTRKMSTKPGGPQTKTTTLLHMWEDIINEYRRDTGDRERMRRGEAVASQRKQELASACRRHLDELDMRYETMIVLQGLLLCQVRWCVCVCLCVCLCV